MTGGFGRRQHVEPTAPLKISASAHHTCRMCANGCRNYDIMLTEQEVRRLSLNFWRDLLYEVPTDAPLVILDDSTGQFVVNKIKDSAGDYRCVFLDSDNLCVVHKASGLEAKPVACQFFPLHAVQSPDGIHLSLNTGCRRLIEMTSADAPLDDADHRADARRLLSQVQAVTTIGETVPLAPDLEIVYSEFLDWQSRLASILDSPQPTFAAYLPCIRDAARLLLTIPGSGEVSGLPWTQLFHDLSATLHSIAPGRPSLARLWQRADQWLPTLGDPSLILAAPDILPEIGPRFLASLARQYLDGQQAAYHRTARTGWTALLAALVAGMLGAQDLIRGAAPGNLNPEHFLNNVVSECLDLFFSPAGQLALTEPNQATFLRALAVL